MNLPTENLSTEEVCHKPEKKEHPEHTRSHRPPQNTAKNRPKVVEFLSYPMQDSNSKFLPPNRFRETSYAVKSTNRDFLNSRNLSRVPVNFTTNPLADEDHVNLLNSMGCSRAAIRGSHSSSDQFLSAQLQEDSCSSSSSASSCGSFNDRDVDNLQGCYYTDRDVLLTTQHSDDKDTTALLCEKNS